MGYFSRGRQKTIDKSPIIDGKIRFAIDTRRLFFDTEQERIEITDLVTGMTYKEIIVLESPLPKLYLSSDSHQLMLYDFKEEEWIIYSGGIPAEKAITSFEFDKDNNIIITYGDGKTAKIINPLNAEIMTINEKISQIIKSVSTLQSSVQTVDKDIENANKRIDDITDVIKIVKS